MSADLSDPNIIATYQEIISFTSPTNWLLLSYGQSRDKLSLYARGQGGIEEIQEQLHGDVFFVFLREERSFILISFVPEDISGVRRARALVHSRAVGSLFKAHHAAWTVTKPEALTVDAIRTKLKLPSDGSRSALASPLTPSYVHENGHERYPSPPSDSEQLRKPPVSNSASTLASPPHSPHRARTQTDGSARVIPTPSPLDTRSGGHVTKDLPSPASLDSTGRRLQDGSTARGAGVTPTGSHSVISKNQSPVASINPDSLSGVHTPDGRAQQITGRQTSSTLTVPQGSSSLTPRTAAQEQAALSRAKWAAESESERRALARQRSQMEMQREAEAEQQAIFDAERSARLKLEREEAMRAEMDEDDRRKLVEQEHARKLAAERVAEEQRRRDEISQKKAMEAQRRREEVAARIRREKEAELERERQAEEKRRQEEERLAAKRAIQQQFTTLRSSGAIMLTGNVTAQADNSMYWRRRYFELSKEGLALYKSVDTPRLDLLALEGRVKAITESHDELQAIPHSFAVEFNDDTLHLFFCDTKEDKELLTSAILQVTEL